VNCEKLLNKFRVYKWKRETPNKETINKYMGYTLTPTCLSSFKNMQKAKYKLKKINNRYPCILD